MQVQLERGRIPNDRSRQTEQFQRGMGTPIVIGAPCPLAVYSPFVRLFVCLPACPAFAKNQPRMTADIRDDTRAFRPIYGSSMASLCNSGMRGDDSLIVECVSGHRSVNGSSSSRRASDRGLAPHRLASSAVLDERTRINTDGKQTSYRYFFRFLSEFKLTKCIQITRL